MEITIEKLSDAAQEIVTRGEDVVIYDWHNTAAGFGLAVTELERKGLLFRKARHIATDPMRSHTVLGLR